MNLADLVPAAYATIPRAFAYGELFLSGPADDADAPFAQLRRSKLDFEEVLATLLEVVDDEIGDPVCKVPLDRMRAVRAEMLLPAWRVYVAAQLGLM